MKSLNFFCLLFVLSAPIVWGGSPTEVTVKVFSCDQKNIGSGVVVSIQNANFVLTSEHVLKPGGEQCYKIRTSSGEIYPVTIYRWEWGIGLALLKFDQLTPLPSIKLTEETIEPLNSFLVVAGYERSVDELSVFNNVSKSPEHSIPLFLSGGNLDAYLVNVSFGMSGGGVFYQDKNNNWHLAGINSHLYSESAGEKILLAIPMSSIYPWTINKGDSAAAYTARLVDSRTLELSGLKFTPVIIDEFKHKKYFDPAGKSGDPIGIGGVTLLVNDVNSDQICLSIKLLDWKKNNMDHMPTHFRATFNKLKMKAYKRQTLELCYFYFKGELVSFSSLEEFSRLMAEGLEPIIRAESQFQSKDEEELEEVANSFSKNFIELQKYVDGDIMNKLGALERVIQSESWEILTTEQLDELIGHSDWSKLYGADQQFFILITNLHSDLMRYRDIHQFILVR